MPLLTVELSELEVEPIELQEVGSTILQREQNKSLETLTTEGKNDVMSILTLTTFLPANFGDGGGCGGPLSCSCSCTCLCALKCGCGCSCYGPNCQGTCSCSCNCTVTH